jgi:hypothetical protein
MLEGGDPGFDGLNPYFACINFMYGALTKLSG